MTPTTDQLGWVRTVANLLQLPGYYLLLHSTGIEGLAIKAFSDLLLIIWGYKNRLYDVMLVTGIFCVMNLERLYEVAHYTQFEQAVHNLTLFLGGLLH